MLAKKRLTDRAQPQRSRLSKSQPAITFDTPRRKWVFLVDDHPLVRERIGELIHQEPDLQVCGEAEDANSALKQIGLLQPDLAVVDLTLKDAYGIELIKDLKERE